MVIFRRPNRGDRDNNGDHGNRAHRDNDNAGGRHCDRRPAESHDIDRAHEPEPVDRKVGHPLPGVTVLLSPGMVDLSSVLARELGPGFAVQTDGSATSGVLIVGPLGAAAMAFLRARHPGMGLLVVDRRWHVPHPDEAVIHLEAGADGYLARPPVAEVASHVRALVRRGRSNGMADRGHMSERAAPKRLAAKKSLLE